MNGASVFGIGGRRSDEEEDEVEVPLAVGEADPSGDWNPEERLLDSGSWVDPEWRVLVFGHVGFPGYLGGA